MSTELNVAPSILTTVHITTENGLLDAAREIRQYLADYPDDVLAVDIETYRSDGKPIDSKKGFHCRPIRLKNGKWEGMTGVINIGFNPRMVDRQFLINTVKLPWDLVGRVLKEPLESATVIGHNLSYDFPYLLLQFGICLQEMRDTQIISQDIGAGDWCKKLPSLMDEYRDRVDYGYFKDTTGMDFDEFEKFKKKFQVSDWSQELSPEQIKYGGSDVRQIFRVYEHQLQEIDRFRAEYEKNPVPGKTIFNPIMLDCSLIPAASMMQFRGVQFDIDRHLNKVIATLEEKKKEAEAELAKYFTKREKKGIGKGKARQVIEIDVPIKARSPYMLEAVRKFVPEIMDMEADTLKFHVDKHPGIRPLVQCNKAAHMLSSFGQKLVNMCDEDGRLRCNWKIIGTKTGRFSSSKPNFQQIPSHGMMFKTETFPGIDAGKFFREGFIAPPGYVLVDYDYAQIEPKIAAWLYNEETLIEEFKRGGDADIYALTAMLLLDLPERPKSKKDFDRSSMKVVFLGKLYRMFETSLAENIKCDTTGEVDWFDEEKWGPGYPKKMSDKFDAGFPKLTKAAREFEKKVREKAEALGSLASFKAKYQSDGRRKPYYIAQNAFGRIEGFYLNQIEEKLPDFMLGKYHYKKRKKKKVDPVTNEIVEEWYESKWNDFMQDLSEAARGAFNQSIQALSADMMKLAMGKIHADCIEAGFDIETEGLIATVHDELLAQFKEEHAEQGAKIMRDAMIAAGECFLQGVVPVKVEGSMGKNWAAAKA